MDEKKIHGITKLLEKKTIKELQSILEENNTNEWTEEAFEAINRILSISSKSQPPTYNEPIFPVLDSKENLDINILPITTLSHANELIYFFEGDYFYYYKANGTKLSKKQIEKIKNSDYSELSKILMRTCEISLSKDVLAFSEGVDETFLLNGEEAIEKVKTMLEDLSTYKNTQTGIRKANLDERFRTATPFLGITVLFAIFLILIPWVFSVEENAPTVHIFMIPFLKIAAGVKIDVA
ncbi:MAG: hypothetical protein KJ826_03510 [Proteobacteria bacterium]|nr:hypothetical protein [Pseudomonadota bacterium]